MLVGPRIAEIGEHAVAHVLGDKPAAAPDHLGNAAMIGADHRAQILRVEPRRECRRADKIAEHHRQLPPFGLDPHPSLPRDPRVKPGEGAPGRPPWGRPSGGREGAAADGCGGQVGDRTKHALAVPEQHLELLKVRLGKLRQNLQINRVVAKALLVLRQSETAQPIGNVHPVSRACFGRDPSLRHC